MKMGFSSAHLDSTQQQACMLNSGKSTTSSSAADVGGSDGALHLNSISRGGKGNSMGGGGGGGGGVVGNSSTAGCPPCWVSSPPPMVPPTDFHSFLSFLPRSTEIFCRQFDAIVLEVLFKVLTTTKPKPRQGVGEEDGTPSHLQPSPPPAVTRGASSRRPHRLSLSSPNRLFFSEMAKVQKSKEEAMMADEEGIVSSIPYKTAEEQDAERRYALQGEMEEDTTTSLAASPVLRAAVIHMGFIGCKRLVDAMWTLLYGMTRAETEVDLQSTPHPPTPTIVSVHPIRSSTPPLLVIPLATATGEGLSTTTTAGGGGGGSGTGMGSGMNPAVPHTYPASPTTARSLMGKSNTDGMSGGAAALLGGASYHGSAAGGGMWSYGSGGSNPPSSIPAPPPPHSWMGWNPLVVSPCNHMSPAMIVALQHENAKNILRVSSPSVSCDYKNDLLQALLKQLFFSPPPVPLVPFAGIASGGHPNASPPPPLPSSASSSFLPKPPPPATNHSVLKSCSSSHSSAVGSGGGGGEPGYAPLASSSSTRFSDHIGGVGEGGSVRHSTQSPPPPPSPSLPRLGGAPAAGGGGACLPPSPPPVPSPSESRYRRPQTGSTTSSVTGSGTIPAPLPLPSSPTTLRRRSSLSSNGEVDLVGSGKRREQTSPPLPYCRSSSLGLTTTSHHGSIATTVPPTLFPLFSAASSPPTSSWSDGKVDQFLVPLFPTLLPMLAAMDNRYDDKGSTLRQLPHEGIHYAFSSALAHHHVEDPADILLLFTFFIESLTEEWYRHIGALSPGLFSLSAPSVVPTVASSSLATHLLPTASSATMAPTTSSTPSPPLASTVHATTLGSNMSAPSSATPTPFTSFTPFVAATGMASGLATSGSADGYSTMVAPITTSVLLNGTGNGNPTSGGTLTHSVGGAPPPPPSAQRPLSSSSSSLGSMGGGTVNRPPWSVSKGSMAAMASAAIPSLLQQWFEQHLRFPFLNVLDILHRATTALPSPSALGFPCGTGASGAGSTSGATTSMPSSSGVPSSPLRRSPRSPHASRVPPLITVSLSDPQRISGTVPNLTEGGGAERQKFHPLAGTSSNPQNNTSGSSMAGSPSSASREGPPFSSALSSMEASPKAGSRSITALGNSSSPSLAVNTMNSSGLVNSGNPSSCSSPSLSPSSLSHYFPYLTPDQRQVAKAHGFFRDCSPLKYADPNCMHDPNQTPRLFQDAWLKDSSFVLHSTDLVFLQPSNKSLGGGNSEKGSARRGMQASGKGGEQGNPLQQNTYSSSRRSSHDASCTASQQVSYEWASSNKMWSIRTRLISLRGHYLYVYSGMSSASVFTEHAGEPSRASNSSNTNNYTAGANPNNNGTSLHTCGSGTNMGHNGSKAHSHPPLAPTSSPSATGVGQRPPLAPNIRIGDVLCYDTPIALIDLCRFSGSPVYLVSGPHDVETVTLRIPGRASGWREGPLWSLPAPAPPAVTTSTSSSSLRLSNKTKGHTHDEEDSAGGAGEGKGSGPATTVVVSPSMHPLATATMEDTEVLRTCNVRREVQLLTLPIPTSVLTPSGIAQTPLAAPPTTAATSCPSSPLLTPALHSPKGPRQGAGSTNVASFNSGLSLLTLPMLASQDSRRRLSHSYRGATLETSLETSHTLTAPGLATPGTNTAAPPLPALGGTTGGQSQTSRSSLSVSSTVTLPPPPPPLPSVTVPGDYINQTMRWLNQHHYKNVTGAPIRQRMYPIRLLVKNELHHFLFQSPGERAKWYQFFAELTWTYHNMRQVQRITRSFRSFYALVRNRFPYPVGPAAFEAISLLGAGTYGHVLLVRHKLTRKEFAMKVVRKNNFLSLRSIIEARREHAMLESLHCPYIMKLHDTFQTESCVYFLLDFLSGGDLLKHIQSAPDHHLSEAMSRFIIAEVAIALEHLRVRGIVHRDLKGDNLVMDAEGHVVLTDFGFAKQITVPRQEDYPKIISLASTGGGTAAVTSGGNAMACAMGSNGGGGGTAVYPSPGVRLPSIVGGNGSGILTHVGSSGAGSSLSSTAPQLTHSKSSSLRYHWANEEQLSHSNNGGSGGSFTTNLNGSGIHHTTLGGNLYTTYPYHASYHGPTSSPLLPLPASTGGGGNFSMTGGAPSAGGGGGAGSVVVIPQHNSCGTVAYIAPEVLRASHQGDGYGLEVDWWSMGIVLFTLLTGLFPFFKDTPRETSHDILHNPVRFPNDMRGGKHIPVLSKEAQHLVLSLLEKNPEKRLSCLRDLKQHPFFKGFDWEACEARRLPPPQELHVDVYTPPCNSRDVVDRLKRRVEWATSLQAHPREQPPASIPVEDPSPYQTSEALRKDFTKLSSELYEIGTQYGVDPPPVNTIQNDIFNPMYARQERCGSDRDIFSAHHDIVLSSQKPYAGSSLPRPSSSSPPSTSFDGGNAGGGMDPSSCIEGELSEDYIPRMAMHTAPTMMMNNTHGSVAALDGGPSSFSTMWSPSVGGGETPLIMSNMSGSFSLLWGGGGGGMRSVQNSAMSLYMGASSTCPVPPIDLEMGLSSEDAESTKNTRRASIGNMSVGVFGDLPNFYHLDPILDDYDDTAYQSHGLREVNYIRDGDTSLYRPVMHP